MNNPEDWAFYQNRIRSAKLENNHWTIWLSNNYKLTLAEDRILVVPNRNDFVTVYYNETWWLGMMGLDINGNRQFYDTRLDRVLDRLYTQALFRFNNFCNEIERKYES